MCIVDETGLTNNSPVEPEVYCATYLSEEQQQRYKLQAGLSALLVTAALLISFAVS